MYKNIELVSKENKDLKVESIKGFKYAKELTQCIITVDEFFKASRSQPIVFAKNEAGEYFASTLLGLEKDKNNFVSSKGDWAKAEYIPAYVRRYPFIFVQNKGTFALAYDADCKEVNTKKGQELFDKDGNETEYVKNIMKFMENFQKSASITSAFIKELDSLGLLEDANASMNVDGKKYAFTGFKRVNEEKLNALDEEQTMKLIKNGSYKLIIAHLISMSNFDKLVSLQK